jgi:Raf kinase inhibitor-like YbhB/YbcL family protein
MVPAASSFVLTSPDISQGQKIKTAQVFNEFGCTGQNISPALEWRNAPQGTGSFALMVHDPDAPTGSGWWHWIAYDIPADVAALPADAGNPLKGLLPKGVVLGRNDYGVRAYGGPCPPPGPAHRYFFRLHALRVPSLELPADASAALIGFNVNANTIAVAEIMATYGR